MEAILGVNPGMSAFVRILLQNSIICGFPMSTYSNSGRFLFRFRLVPVRVLLFGLLFHYFHTFQPVAGMGGGLFTYRASFRRFCAVAVSRTSSRAPLNPRSRSRSSLNMFFMCAKAISTFLRSSLMTANIFVFAKARA
jgi:hypothetical protein